MSNCRLSPGPDDGTKQTVVSDVGGDTSLRAASVDDVDQRRCGWCGSVLPLQVRQDAKFCGKRCRQASWRFKVGRADIEATDRPMIFAYADPPYPSKAYYYPEQSEVDHASLLEKLTRDYPDGWALSTSSKALRDVLSLCPGGVRICAWFKGPRHTKSRRALVSWEPLIVAGGRPLRADVVQDLSDGLVAVGRFRRFPGAMIGMKPPAFAEWMFRQLGASRGDRLDDLFPGSGAIGRAWIRFTAQDARAQATRSNLEGATGDSARSGSAG